MSFNVKGYLEPFGNNGKLVKYSLILLRFNTAPLKHRYSHFAIEFLIVLMPKL